MNQMVFFASTMSEAVNKGYSWLDAFAPKWRETIELGTTTKSTQGKAMFIAKWKKTEEGK